MSLIISDVKRYYPNLISEFKLKISVSEIFRFRKWKDPTYYQVELCKCFL